MAYEKARLATVFGGSGFIGTQVVQELARKGYRIRVAVRRPDLAGHVRPLGAVGQIMPVQANVRNAESVARAVAGANIVINLVGILAEGGRQRFRAVHTMGARNIAEAAKAAGVQHLVHVSALGADPESPSAYQRSKALGEEDVLKVFPDAVIIRPSIVFGPGDSFFNRFGQMARYFPVMPLMGANTRYQPVYVGDVAEAIAAAGAGLVKGGKAYEIGGPEIETMRELLQRLLREIGRHRPLLPVPFGLARLMATFLQFLPNPMLTPDQVIQLGIDNIVSEEANRQRRTLAAFGINPTSMDAILPSYVWRFRKHGQFEHIES